MALVTERFGEQLPEPSEARFERAQAAPAFAIAMSIGALTSQTLDEHGIWLLSISLVGLVVGVADFLWGRSRPVLSISPHSLSFRRAIFLPRREVVFREVAAWAATGQTLSFELLDRSWFNVPLMMVRKDRRETLLANLSNLNVGMPGVGTLTEADVRRRDTRNLALAFTLPLVITAATVALVYWFIL